MTSNGRSLDARLRGVYQGLDTSPGFDARVMARARAERDASAAERAAQARAEETRRYELTRRGQSWRARIRRAVTLDSVGAAVLAGLALRSIWSGVLPQASEFLLMHGAQALTALGMLLAVGTLPPLFLLYRRRSPKLA